MERLGSYVDSAIEGSRPSDTHLRRVEDTGSNDSFDTEI